MKPTYRVKDWDVHFENHDSRKINNARWLPMPNKHDGKSFRRLAAHRDGVAAFAGWTLILQVASKMPTRGVLADEDGPLDAEDISAMTGFPAAIFDLAFGLLTQPKIAWLEITSGQRDDFPLLPGASRNFALEQNGTEANGTTENRKEEVGSRENSRSPNSDTSHQPVKCCDEEFLEELQRSEAYKMLPVRTLYARMVHWCELRKKQPTRRRLINWLNREDKPMLVGNNNGNGNGNGTSQTGPNQTAAERRSAAVVRNRDRARELRSLGDGPVESVLRREPRPTG